MSAANSVLDDLLCVSKTNDYSEGQFYGNLALQTTAAFSEFSGDPSYTEAVIAPSIDAVYDRNDSISAFVNSGATYLVSTGDGYFQVPTPDFSGDCNDASNALFGVPIPGPFSNGYSSGTTYSDIAGKDRAAKCVRRFSAELSEWERQCVSQESMNRYVHKLYIAATADVYPGVATLTTSSASVKAVTVGHVHFTDRQVTPATLTEMSSWSTSCATEVYNSEADYNAVSASCKAGTAPASYPWCNNVVERVDYVVESNLDASNSINSVKAFVTLTGMPANTTSLMQRFSVNFGDTGSGVVGSAENGNVAKRTRSGNPGYLLGAPVLYSSSISGTAQVEVKEGLTVPSAFSLAPSQNFGGLAGTCPKTTETIPLATVPFGYSTTTGCSVELSVTELEQLCCENNGNCVGTFDSEYTDSTGVPFFLRPNSATASRYIGIYGNADPSSREQWVSYAAPTVPLSRSWVSSTGTCTGMTTSLNYKFLVTKTGESKNPQDKIVAIQVTYGVSDVRIAKSALDSEEKGRVQFTTTVSFIRDDGSLEGYSPPDPPVLFKVPYDVFYPFFLDSSPAPRGAPISFLSLGLLGAAVLCSNFFMG
jgi:hypothetical protein